jgi:ribosomal protein L37AE/L43A
VPGLIAVEPQGSKLQRADAATPQIEAGNVYLVEGPWVMDFIEEHTIFPNGANDDQVDASGQGINYLRGKNYAYGLLGFEQMEIDAQRKAYEDEMERAKTMSKPDRGAQSIGCPKCKSRTVVRIGNQYRCNSCTNQWPVPNVGAAQNTDAYMRK